MDTYKSALRSFFLYAATVGLSPIEATEFDICHYLCYLAERGTVKMSSLQPYLSAINTYLQDIGLEPVAKGRLVTSTRHGLERMQYALVVEPDEVALPAPAAKAMHDLAVTLAATLSNRARTTSASVFLEQLKQLRALLCCVLTFLTASRPVSIVTLTHDDITLDLTVDTGLIVRRHYTKTARGELADDRPGRFALTFQTSHFRDFIIAMQAFAALRARHMPHAQYFFQLPGDGFESPPDKNGPLLVPWMALALAAVQVTPPDGSHYTPRSLRSGAASACEKAGIPRSTLEFLGGWCAGSTALAKHYINPLIPATPAGRFFFAHLCADDASLGTWQPTPVPH